MPPVPQPRSSTSRTGIEAAEKQEEEQNAEREDQAPVPLKDEEQSDYRKKK